MIRISLALIALTFLAFWPGSNSGQGGVGGRVTHDPDLGCACVEPFDKKITVDNNTSQRKLSTAECVQKGDVEKVYSGKEVDKKVKLAGPLPAPEWPSNRSDVTGTVLIRAV